MVGRTLSHYRIAEKIGAGGMGEVYRATDLRLGREVALKFLPEPFARDPERLARFDQEARLLASLSHPNIAGLYGLEESGGVRFLSMELVAGETLAEKIARGPLPIDEALSVCREVVAALEAAHERGVIHRDLKPGNVKITPEGKAKVLDFGLAKVFGAEMSAGARQAGTDFSQSPTLTVAATRDGVLLGTAAYMSPEQARGKPVDRRTDIWSFGCVLFEALSGRRPFDGETISDTLSAVLRAEPDWALLPRTVPPAARRLLRRCLAKDATVRLQHIGDARLELEEIAAGGPAGEAAEFPEGAGDGERPGRAARRRLARLLPWGVAVICAVLAFAAVARGRGPAPPTGRAVKRFSIVLPPGDTLAVGGRTLDVSPDGKTLVYAALRDGKRHLFTRAADSGAVTLLPGTEGGGRPFFSPDGEWVGFIGSLDLRKLSLRGGTPVLLAQVAFNATAVWGLSGQIILSSSEIDPLSVVPEAGGMPKPLTALSGGGGEIAHLWPSLLPGKDAVLFMAWSGSGDEGSRLAVADLDSGRITDLGVRGMSPRYAPSGHLLFGHAGTLFAVRFDPGSRRVRGTPVPVVSGVMTFARFGVSQYALSGDGTLYYIRGEPGGSEGSLTWVDTTGASELVMEPTNGFQSARLSPDGNRLALSIREPDPDIWVHDLRRKTLTRVTFAPGEDESPVWSPDGASLAYTSNGRKKTFLLSLDGSGREEELVSREHHYHVRSWSPDGKWLFFEEFVSPNNSDIWALPLRQPRTPRLLAHSRFSESAPKISPNGRWLAYASNESGRSEIYIQPFPGPGRRVQVSTLGGREPVWARSGGELFFQRETKVVSVRVGGGAEPEAEGERVICEIGPEPDATWLFDISTDGRRFIVANPPVPKDRPTEIQVVVNWLEELEQKVPVKGH